LKIKPENIVLKAHNLAIGYTNKKETTVIAKNINFELQKGSLIGLIGTNGIGKSTLLKTITQQLPVINGNFFIDKEDINQIQPHQLATKISVVLTENVSNINLSVQELITLGRQPYTNWIGTLKPKDIQKTEEAMQLTNITHLAHKRCFELSDGQLQKVMLARALAQDTPLIILDEPTTHLDLYHKVSVLKLLQQLAQEMKKTILFSTHEINVALSLCDQLIVMKKEETSIGSPQELIAKKAFDNLFPSDLVTFDKKTSSFKIK